MSDLSRPDNDLSTARSDDMPDEDQHIIDAQQPGTQDSDPLEAELGEDGQGDLAPEDDPAVSETDEGPTDLRTSL